MSGIDEILAGYDGLQASQEAFYKDLHEHPELSHQEHRTARRVADQLQGHWLHGPDRHRRHGSGGRPGQRQRAHRPAALRTRCAATPGRHRRARTRAPSTVQACQRPRGASGPCLRPRHAHGLHARHGQAHGRPPRPWNGTLITLFQPAEETGDGAQGMVDDGLFKRIPAPDVALAQHLLPGIAGTVGTRSGPFMAAEDSIKVTVYGRGGHGALPQHAIDPVVLAAMIIVRLQTVVSREVAPGDTAVLTVGSVQAGTRSNVIPDHAVLQLNMRSYSQPTRQRMLDAIQRIVRAECQASGSPKDPDFETLASFPVTRQRRCHHGPGGGRLRRAFRRPRDAKSPGRPSARTSATSPTPRASRTPTGASGSPTGRPTSPPRRPGTWRTCPPTTPRSSCPRCSPPCEPAPRPWSRPRSPGCPH